MLLSAAVSSVLFFAEKTATRKMDLNLLRRVLEMDPSVVNISDKNDGTPLERVASNNDTGVMKMLLEFNADIDGIGNARVLTSAISNGHEEAVKLLFEHKVKIHYRVNENYSTLLQFALSKGNERIIALLLEYMTGNRDAE